MEKRTYIQPEMEVAVMPKDAMMGWQNSPGEELNPAPSRVGSVRRTEVF